MEIDLVNFIIGFVFVAGAAWILLSNFPKIESVLQGKLSESLDRDSDDKSHQPLADIFLDFDHSSINDWVKWIAEQDKAIKEEAYTKILDYLNSEPEHLGAVTGDAIKALAAFKKAGTFRIIDELLSKIRERFQMYKSIDLFYEEACKALIKENREEAVAYLSNEFAHYLEKDGSEKIQGYIIKSLMFIEDLHLILDLLSSIIANSRVKRSIKLELVLGIERRDSDQRKIFYKECFRKFLNSGSSSLSDDDQFVIEQIFSHCNKFVIDENYDKELWQVILDICDLPKLRTLFIKLISDLLVNSEQKLSSTQTMSLLIKADPAKSSFREALARRFRITDRETEVIKMPFKFEDIVLQKDTAIVLEKSKKTRIIIQDLIDNYNALEKIISANESGKGDKGQGFVNLIAGDAKYEKEYLLRTICANNNKSFICVNFERLITDKFEVVNLKNMANNCKPCIVYFDNIEQILVRELNKAEALHLKELNKVVCDLSAFPTIFFCANVNYKRETFKQFNPELFDVLQGNNKGNYKFAFSLDKPEEKQRREILTNFQGKVNNERLVASSKYSSDLLIDRTESKSTLEYLIFLYNYFEYSLLVNGMLADVDEFIREASPYVVMDIEKINGISQEQNQEALTSIS